MLITFICNNICYNNINVFIGIYILFNKKKIIFYRNSFQQIQNIM